MSRIDCKLEDYPLPGEIRQKVDDQPPEMGFMDALDAFGIELQGSIQTGKIVRVNHRNAPGKKTAWYLFFGVDPVSSIAGGVFGDWRYSDDRQHWSNKAKYDVSAEQWAHYEKRVAEQKAKAEAEKQQMQDAAAKKAVGLLAHKEFIDIHPYLTKKKVQAHGVFSDTDGALLVPMVNNAGELRNVQRVYANSNKRFSTGAQVTGCYHLLGSQLTNPTYIAEGYATAATIYEATGGQAVLVAFNTGNLLPVAKAIREHNPDIKLIFAADNDRETEKRDGKNPGVMAAKKAAEAVGNALVRIPDFSTSTGTDFNDLLISDGAEVVLAQVTGQTVAQRAKGVQIQRLGTVDPYKEIDWLLDGYFLRDSLACIYGPSGTGKSFAALDYGLTIATGGEWHGHAVKHPGPVLYICGEGQAGIARRAMAWCHDRGHNYDEVNFYLTTGAVHFLDASQFMDLADKVEALQDAVGQPFAMVIIDTLNRNFGPGDENRTDDMTAFVNGMDTIRKLTGGAVTVVHHTGLADSSRARGSSALRASLDTEIEIGRKDKESPITLLCRKQKDADEAKPIAFNLIPISYATSDKGTPIGSAVLKSTDYVAIVSKENKEIDDGSPEGLLVSILVSELEHVDQIAKTNGEFAAADPKVSMKEFKEKFYARYKKAGKTNPTTAYNRLIGADYFAKYATLTGTWYNIKRDNVVASAASLASNASSAS